MNKKKVEYKKGKREKDMQTNKQTGIHIEDRGDKQTMRYCCRVTSGEKLRDRNNIGQTDRLTVTEADYVTWMRKACSFVIDSSDSRNYAL